MVLSAGCTVTQYIDANRSPSARTAALVCVQMLSIQYPDQLPHSTWEGTFMQRFPMDVRRITSQHVSDLVVQHPAQHFLLVAGWRCEDLSAAASGRGWSGSLSSSFFDTVRVLGSFLQLVANPPAYLLENTHMLWPHTAKRVKVLWVKCVSPPHVLD